jgi:hypothetical protein
VLIGTAVFGERLASSPGGLAVQLCAAATAVAGIVVLGRSPLGEPVTVPAQRPPSVARAADRDLLIIHSGGTNAAKSEWKPPE